MWIWSETAETYFIIAGSEYRFFTFELCSFVV